MQKQSIKTLVFSSSATVYGEPKYLPVDESHPINANNPYGRTKVYIEEMLKDISKSDANWRIVTLRYFNPVGAHESGLIGENPDGVPNNLMPYISRVAVGKLPFLNIYGSNYATVDGTGVRDYIHVMDLAESHLAGLRYLQNYAGWHAFNIGAGNRISVFELVNAYKKYSGCNIPVRVVERRTGDLPSCYANVNLANTSLNWKAKYSLDEMCNSEWYYQVKTKEKE
jgi:UDP-glucose 4-epimerase